MRDINQEYQRLSLDKGATAKLTGDWKTAVDNLDRKISSIDQDLKMQMFRAESLLRLVADRKTLVREMRHLERWVLY